MSFRFKHGYVLVRKNTQIIYKHTSDTKRAPKSHLDTGPANFGIPKAQKN